MTQLTVVQAACLLNEPVSTVRRWCQTGKLPARRHGRAWVIESDDLPMDALKAFATRFTEEMADYIVARAVERGQEEMNVAHVANAIRKYGREWKP